MLNVAEYSLLIALTSLTTILVTAGAPLSELIVLLAANALRIILAPTVTLFRETTSLYPIGL